ncbi:phosphatidate cytidylyltransferase [Rhodohalobacter sp. SW132]|uniref:phosphatidate cytidylyltransferase n=1 Tax=Rhodohalobacter sp. SW132 TaxID=2293433 RepID=UPI001315059F|nr:phosphatidate cytidylyltransferase [Rhodohalobacter sp. SW132]
MSELTKRILFAVPAATLFIWLAWMGGIYFNTIMALLALGTVWEVDRLMKNAGFGGFFGVSVAIAALLWFSSSLPSLVVLAGFLAAIIPLIAFLFKKYHGFGYQWISMLFCGLYAPIGYLMVVHVRELGVDTQGFWLILSLFFMIWGNDIFAYFIGRSFGKNKLAPNVSPNKSWEGFWGGFLGAATGALIAWGIAADFPLTLVELLPAAVVVSITGPLGDLTESRLKRLAGMKDSSSLLPGHGGLFDRFDAMILTAPFLFFYFTFFL